LLVFLAFFPTVASAENETVGSIKTVEGSAVIVRSGSLLEAHPEILLQCGDVFRTGENGRLGVILRDDTLLSLGGDTEMNIEEFAFAPGEDRLLLPVA
jgi:hypothetical protein